MKQKDSKSLSSPSGRDYQCIPVTTHSRSQGLESGVSVVSEVKGTTSIKKGRVNPYRKRRWGKEKVHSYPVKVSTESHYYWKDRHTGIRSEYK